MTIPIIHVDAFTSKPFSGNPAAVCVLPEARDAAWMQNVAREMNLSETAFLRRREAGFDLRWFAPGAEVDLCGHATLASAHALWETGRLAPGEPARFHTRGGLLTATRRGEWIELDFPALGDEPAQAPPGLIEALGAAPRYVGKSRSDYIVELDGEAAVLALRPDFARLKSVSTRGVIATSRSNDPGFDFVSRFFAPVIGVDEDPATGSSHCTLAPFWAKRLDKSTLLARQVSARGGVLKVQLAGERVLLCGQAVTVLRGELLA